MTGRCEGNSSAPLWRSVSSKATANNFCVLAHHIYDINSTSPCCSQVGKIGVANFKVLTLYAMHAMTIFYCVGRVEHVDLVNHDSRLGGPNVIHRPISESTVVNMKFCTINVDVNLWVAWEECIFHVHVFGGQELECIASLCERFIVYELDIISSKKRTLWNSAQYCLLLCYQVPNLGLVWNNQHWSEIHVKEACIDGY